MNSNDFYAMELSGDRRVPTTNNTRRRLRVGELIFAEGYIGSVRSRGDVPPGGDFEIETRSDCTIHTQQITRSDDYKYGAVTLYFESGDAGFGVFRTSPAPGRVAFPVIVTDIDIRMDRALIRFIPPYQNGDLKAEGEDK